MSMSPTHIFDLNLLYVPLSPLTTDNSYYDHSFINFSTSALFLQNENQTAVYNAARQGHLEKVKALVAPGADLSIASLSTMLVTL